MDPLPIVRGRLGLSHMQLDVLNGKFVHGLQNAV